MTKYKYIQFGNLGNYIGEGFINLEIRPLKTETLTIDGSKWVINEIDHSEECVTLEVTPK